MATPALNSQVQSLVAEYSVFWQFWPQFEQIHGERRLVGFELELIGSHTSDLNHLETLCPALPYPLERKFRANAAAAM